MARGRRLPRKRKGEFVTADDWNALCDRVDAGEVTVAAPLSAKYTPAGVALSVALSATHAPVVRLDSAADCGGTYYGVLWRRPASVGVDPAGSTWAESDVGEEGDDVVIVNAAEEGLATHDLTDGGNDARLPILFVASYRGTVAAAGDDFGKPVYLVDGYKLEDCS